MRLSTAFISCTFVLAGLSTAFPVERGSTMLIARFADSDFLSELEARAYYNEADEFYRGHKGVVSENDYRPPRHRSFHEHQLTRRRGEVGKDNPLRQKKSVPLSVLVQQEEESRRQEIVERVDQAFRHFQRLEAAEANRH